MGSVRIVSGAGPSHSNERSIALVFGANAKNSDHFSDDLMDRAARQFDFQFAGFDLGQIENIVDQLQQMLAAGMNRVEKFQPFGFAVFIAAAKNIGETEDRVHRRADFMAHPRQEFALGAVGLIGRLLGFAQLDFLSQPAASHPQNWPARFALSLARPPPASNSR